MMAFMLLFLLMRAGQKNTPLRVRHEDGRSIRSRSATSSFVITWEVNDVSGKSIARSGPLLRSIGCGLGISLRTISFYDYFLHSRQAS